MSDFSATEVDLAYAAGIIDGEGTIVISEIPPTGRRKSPQHRVSMAVAMTDAGTPMWLHSIFGGSVGTYDYYPGVHRPQTRWTISTSMMVDCLEALLPYLRLKKAQAELAIALQKRLTARKGSKGVPDDELSARREMRDQMQTLNARRAV